MQAPVPERPIDGGMATEALPGSAASQLESPPRVGARKTTTQICPSYVIMLLSRADSAATRVSFKVPLTLVLGQVSRQALRGVLNPPSPPQSA